MNQRRIGAVLTYVQTFLHIVISLLYVPLLLGTIGQSEYGLFQLIGSVMAYIAIAEALLSSGVLRYYCKYRDLGDTRMMENTLALSRRIYWLFSALVAVIGAALIVVVGRFYRSSLTPGELTEAKYMIAVLTAGIIFNLVSYVYSAAITANERFIFSKSLVILSTVSQPLLVLLLVRFYPRALLIVCIQAGLALAVALAKWLYARRRLHIRVVYHGRDPELVKKLLVFSAGVFLAALADQIFWKADQLILGKLFGSAAVAVYAIGAQIYGNYRPAGTSIASVFLPRVSALYNVDRDMDAISALFAKTGRLVFLLAALVLSGFALFGREFIRLWAGEGYSEAYVVALVVMVPLTVDMIQYLGLTILQVLNRYAFRGKMYFIIAALNIVSTIFFAQWWGLTGAAISTAASMVVGSGILMNVYYARVGLDVRGFWRGVAGLLPGALLAAAAGLAIRLLRTPNAWLTLGLHIGVYTAVYCAVMYFLAMNAYERGLIRGVLRRRS